MYTEDIVKSIMECMDASRDLEKCRESAGMEAGHFCSYQKEEVNRVSSELERLLDNWFERKLIAYGLIEDRMGKI